MSILSGGFYGGLGPCLRRDDGGVGLFLRRHDGGLECEGFSLTRGWGGLRMIDGVFGPVSLARYPRVPGRLGRFGGECSSTV